MTERVLITQAADRTIDLEWTEGDPITLTFEAYELDDDGVTEVALDWSGNYTCQVRPDPASSVVSITLTVAATFNTPVTLFELTASAANSALVPAGEYVWDCQETGGVTRFGGRAIVQPQVTR
jgi:hypothetical protein